MVLAAGLGERMRPLTDWLPKPLLPIANCPVMGHILRHLGRHGFSEIVANVHYRPEEIVDHFGAGSDYGVNLTFSYEEELLGSAGGVRRCREFFGDETFLVTGADDLTTMDLTSLLSAHRRTGAIASIGLVEVEQTSEYGIVVTDEDGRIDRFVEKPKGRAPSRTANTQIYLFEPDVFDFIPRDQPYDFGFNVFPAMVEAGVPFYGFQLPGYWRDIGNVGGYLESQVDVLEGKLCMPVPGSEIAPGVRVGAGCEIDESARLTAPVLLGDRCHVQRKAEIGGGSTVGDEATIAPGASLWRSVVWEGATVPDEARLKDAVVSSQGVFGG